jgi:hypothetical protein
LNGRPEGDELPGPLRWAAEHPVAVAVAGVIGVASGLLSNTFPDYTDWQAFATGWGMFGLSLWVVKEFLSDDED